MAPLSYQKRGENNIESKWLSYFYLLTMMMINLNVYSYDSVKCSETC